MTSMLRSESHRRLSMALWWVAAVVATLLVLAAALQFARNPAARLVHPDGPVDLYKVATGVVFTAGAAVLVVGGLAWWRHRPAYLTGPLMVALGADWALVQALTWTFQPWARAGADVRGAAAATVAVLAHPCVAARAPAEG